MNGQSVQFGPTTEQLAVSLDIVEDVLVEGEEDLMFSLTSLTVGGQTHSGAQIGMQSVAQIFINENDGELCTLALLFRMVVETFLWVLLLT